MNQRISLDPFRAESSDRSAAPPMARPRLQPCAALGLLLRHLNGMGQISSSQREIEVIVSFVNFVERRLRLASLAEVTGTHIDEFVCAPLWTRTGIRQPDENEMQMRRSAIALLVSSTDSSAGRGD